MQKHEKWNLLSKGCNSFNFYAGGWESFWPGLLKFKYSEKATKFVEIFLLVLTSQRNVKLFMREISLIFYGLLRKSQLYLKDF